MASLEPQSKGASVAAADEVVPTLSRIGRALDALAIRGLRAAGPDDTAQLDAFRAELAGMGAAHLAALLERLLQDVKGGRREAPRTMLHALTALRMLERLYTLRRVGAELERAHPEAEGGAPRVATPPAALPALPALKPGFLDAIAVAVEEVFLSGLTAASDATVQALRVGFQEASGKRLLRLGSTLRVAMEEIARFTASGGRDGSFGADRLVFFLGRAWMLARAMASALETGDAARFAELSFTPPSQPVEEIRLVIAGVSKRFVPGAFAAFELRARATADAGPLRRGDPLLWSFVFPIKPKSEVPPEAYLLLSQPQKFVPGDLLSGREVIVSGGALGLHETPRVALKPNTTVTLGDRVDGWRSLLGWSPARTLERVRAHVPDPLALPVELSDEVLLESWSLGSFAASDRPYERAELTSGELSFEVRVDAGGSGAPLREALTTAARAPSRPPLFGFVHFEHGRIVLQPLSLLRDDGPDHVHLSRDKIDKTALVKALRFD